MEIQAQTRQKLLAYREDTGIKWNFIAKRCGISPQLLSHFVKDRSNLGDDNLMAVMEFLEQNGVEI